MMIRDGNIELSIPTLHIVHRQISTPFYQLTLHFNLIKLHKSHIG